MFPREFFEICVKDPISFGFFQLEERWCHRLRRLQCLEGDNLLLSLLPVFTLLLLHKEVFRRTVELWRVRHVPAREDGGGEGRLGLSSSWNLPVEVGEDVDEVELHGPLGGEVDRHVAGVVV